MAKQLIDAVSKHNVDDLAIGDEYQPIPLSELIAKLQVIESELILSDWQDLQIHIGIELGDYCDGELKLAISGKRPETDKEEERRLKAEEREATRKQILADARVKNLARKEAQEFAEYARLRAKYDRNTVDEVDRNPNKPGKLGDM